MSSKDFLADDICCISLWFAASGEPVLKPRLLDGCGCHFLLYAIATPAFCVLFAWTFDDVCVATTKLARNNTQKKQRNGNTSNKTYRKTKGNLRKRPTHTPSQNLVLNPNETQLKKPPEVCDHRNLIQKS